LPSNPYAKTRPTLAEALVALAENNKVADLDEYDLESIAGFPFGENTEEISLFNNNIVNPNEVAEHLTALPNLKALWL
jgi:hypothetical protein